VSLEESVAEAFAAFDREAPDSIELEDIEGFVAELDAETTAPIALE
jgi:hypothetical protein